MRSLNSPFKNQYPNCKDEGKLKKKPLNENSYRALCQLTTENFIKEKNIKN